MSVPVCQSVLSDCVSLRSTIGYSSFLADAVDVSLWPLLTLVPKKPSGIAIVLCANEREGSGSAFTNLLVSERATELIVVTGEPVSAKSSVPNQYQVCAGR